METGRTGMQNIKGSDKEFPCPIVENERNSILRLQKGIAFYELIISIVINTIAIPATKTIKAKTTAIITFCTVENS